MTIKYVSKNIDGYFLSCLSGSDADDANLGLREGFLSCLSGSDGGEGLQRCTAHFLSCLSGSDVETTSLECLIVKEKSSFSA